MNLMSRPANSNVWFHGNAEWRQAGSRLSDLIRVLERSFGFAEGSLSRDSIPDSFNLEKNGKEFCVGLLENPVTHCWYKKMQKLSASQKLSVSGTLFLSRKVLPPSSNSDMLTAVHQQKLGTASDPLTLNLNLFVQAQIHKMFKKGWDRRYRNYVENYIPNDSCSLESSRSKGGSRRYLAERGEDIFISRCQKGMIASRFAKFGVVRTSGKDRGITIASANQYHLGPLHQIIYDHLSKFPWLLRGEATAKRFREFTSKKGNVFVSGDYESATDNLNINLSKVILSSILRSSSLPDGLSKLAMESLEKDIVYPDGKIVIQKSGQLMGNLLSFPLLCLANYLLFRFIVSRKEVPDSLVKINGDDIVFRSSRDVSERWMSRVSDLGLTLSEGKTLVNERNFSLNSTFFRAGSKNVHLVPVIRLSADTSKLPSDGGFSKFVKGWSDTASFKRKREIGALWLRERRQAIEASGRGLFELGIRANHSQIHLAGLTRREAWYRELSFLSGRVNAPPSRLIGSGSYCEQWSFVPSKFAKGKFGTKTIKIFSRMYARAAYLNCWRSSAKVLDEKRWWEQIRASGGEERYSRWKKAGTWSIFVNCGFSPTQYTLRNYNDSRGKLHNVLVPRSLVNLSALGLGHALRKNETISFK